MAGFDVVAHAADVRQRIGVAAQQATVDGLLSARLNLEMVGRLYGLSKAEARRRGDALLEQLDLTDAATKLVKTFSGGMRRRLDLAASIIANPEVLFLDEPTTGLDPRSRGDLWQILRDLVRDGTTIILTTQYLEEADRLADDIVVLDHGRTVAHGTPAELKARIGDDRIDVKVSASSELVAAAGALSAFASNDASFDEDLLIVTAPITEGTRLIDVVRALDEAGIDAVDLNRRQATLDDVFLALTSRSPDTAPTPRSLATTRPTATRCPYDHHHRPHRRSARRPTEPTPRGSVGRRARRRRLAGVRPPQHRAHPPDPREAARRHDAADHVRAAVLVRVRRRDLGRPAARYREFIIGGILIQSLAFGMTGPATSIATDLQEGVIDRFRSLPASSPRT